MENTSTRGAGLEISKSIQVVGLKSSTSVCREGSSGSFESCPKVSSEIRNTSIEASELRRDGIGADISLGLAFSTNLRSLGSSRPVRGSYFKQALRPISQPPLGCLLQYMQ